MDITAGGVRLSRKLDQEIIPDVLKGTPKIVCFQSPRRELEENSAQLHLLISITLV
jgi:hypothetical protein